MNQWPKELSKQASKQEDYSLNPQNTCKNKILNLNISILVFLQGNGTEARRILSNL